ncbi:MAG: cyclic nucleotide-binding domain-containing protein [Deltaproteobacteria bacterium]|nr:cyclic nucleotide-binding domain-containing protein [Deltaproteobacteria bacterium]
MVESNPGAAAERALSDSELRTLRENRLLAALKGDELGAFVRHLVVVEFAPGASVVREREPDRDMYFILAGKAHLSRSGMNLGHLGPGEHFGEIGLVTGRPRAASVSAVKPLVLARLSRPAYERLGAEAPSVALHVTQSYVSSLGNRLAEMTDRVDVLLCERSMPRRTDLEVHEAWGTTNVKTGTPIGKLLPASIDGVPVVAGLLDQKAVSLGTPLTSDATISALTLSHWEGRRIYQASVGLVLLEAANRVAPNADVRLGPSAGLSQQVFVSGLATQSLADFAGQLTGNLNEIIAEGVEFRTEWWTVEEATAHFVERGWTDAAKLLQSWRGATVPLSSCGAVYVLAAGPLLRSTKSIEKFTIVPRQKDLLLLMGGEDALVDHAKQQKAAATNGAASSPFDEIAMVRAHARWLEARGVDGVGSFNELCVSGRVAEIIRVGEGFHEKRFAQIADDIASGIDSVRVVCIAGPSSSGKTTFIKRLTVQLEINGISPCSISLDDYYVDRDKTVRDELGEYDFEALEALDLNLLHNHLRRIMADEAVKTARYDFRAGKSHAAAGPEIRLGARNILMLEGIHGLNPRLIGEGAGKAAVYRVFVNPMTALPFDRLSRVNVSDVRLLRRIVRDRHGRGHNAADTISRWPSVRTGERKHIYPYMGLADAIFDSSLSYEIAVLKVFAERYLLEVPRTSDAYMTAFRLRQLINHFVTIYPDHVPPTSILREFIGGSAFEY